MLLFRQRLLLRGKLVAISLAFLLMAFSLPANAQKNDLGFTMGGYFTADTPLNLGAAFAMEGSYARRIVHIPVISVYGELPLAGSFTSSIPDLNGTELSRSYTSLFITPGVRVRLIPSFFLSPYVAAGLGYGRFNRKLYDGTTAIDNAFALDVGGGLDMKILPFTSLRAEVRDFNSSSLTLPSIISAGRQNNIFLTFGLSVKF